MTEQIGIIMDRVSKLDSESTKRLMDHCASQFKNGRHSRSTERIPFDDKVRDVVLKYARDPDTLVAENQYLDSIGYGCKYVKGMLQSQLESYVVDQDTHKSSWPSFRWNKNYKMALKIVEGWLLSRVNNLEIKFPQSEDDLKYLNPKLETHAGFLYVESGKKTKRDNLPGLLTLVKQYLQFGKDHGTFGRPVLAGHRLQCSGAYNESGRTGTFKRKVRYVAIKDYIDVTIEAMFAKPFQALMNTMPWYGAGKDPTQLRDLINSNRNRYPYWLSLDFSHYDQSVPKWLLEDIFMIIWNVFKTNPVNRQYKWIYDIVVHDFIYKGLVGEDGKLYFTDHAIQSGASFTNQAGTIGQIIMDITYLLSISIDPNRTFLNGCGDDGLIMTNVYIDPEHISSYMRHNFGMTCNAQKCKYGKVGDSDPQYLSRTWRVRGADRDEREVWAKLLYPERFRPYHKDGVTPELVLYSYIMAFPLALERMIDLNHFYSDNPNLKHVTKRELSSVLPYMSGYLSYAYQYGVIAVT